ncbi:type I polyketide synthase [Streptomyces sp. ISL-86]|uniref:type I polyketide synthase n=1 Tax=Streptomyces sp. ISL-86 TaxID=2819187 RepID=UPI0025523F82|nr:beta-ketoacyl synthase N-terminal-like domain-containing protein [Streptomyces sp. ISL-86]
MRDTSLDVAVVGMAARLPGPSDFRQWWDGIVEGQTFLASIPRDDLLRRGVPAHHVDDPDYVPVHGVLEGVDRFDNDFFRISPREAERMDPQHRLALEVAWQALEDAGVRPNGGALRTGVFASSTGSTYLRWILARQQPDPGAMDDLIHGTEPDFLASRISYKLGLTGPAMAVQTACSSSLVAVHLAVQSLINGDCEQAVVVATGMNYPQAGYIHLPGGVQSRTGRLRPFDSEADGVVGGSGAACVVLRLLSDVNDDEVEPHGVILGTAINNDGSGKAGYYAPSLEGQERAIREAIHTADIDASTLGYLQMHGTGTSVGDPLEWSAASSALTAEGAVPGQIAVGAVKANVGHLDACAGLASLVTTLTVLKTGTVPPIAGFRELNPLIADPTSPLFVPDGATPWTAAEPRRAGISAFGIGGTNAHVIVEAARRSPETAEAPRSDSTDGPLVLPVSAASADALTRTTEALADWLDAEKPALAEVARTLVTGRAELNHRRAVVASTVQEAASLLRRRPDEAPQPTTTPPLIFAFPGQGAQRPGMAKAYQQVLPGFSAALDSVLQALPLPLRDRVGRALNDSEFPADQLDQTELAQPAVFCLQVAAVSALRELGVKPSAVLGHSLGELAAATAAGVLDVGAAVAFVVERGKAMQACPPGRMLALACSESQARELIAGTELEIAAVNGPEACVFAGTEEEIRLLSERVDAGTLQRVLRTTRGFHSRLVDPALDALRDAVSGLTNLPATCVFASGLRAGVSEVGEVPDPVTWVDAARSEVRFGDALAALAVLFPGAVAVEIGPGRPLASLLEAADLRTAALGSPKPETSELALRTGLADLWAGGYPVALADLTPPARAVHLPAYPFAGPRHVPQVAADAPVITTAGASTGTPATGAAEAGQPAEPVMTDPATLVQTSWRELFGHENLTDSTDFFDAGGDSLLITRLVRKLNQALGIRIPVRDLLRARTLGGHVTVVAEALQKQN